MLWNYYINIYKNNPNFFQYPPDNNINNIEIFKQYLITNWLAEANPSLKNKTNIAKSVTTKTIENNILIQMQNELAGTASNFKVTTRREFILTDFASNFNYRFVNIDSLNPHSLKIIQSASPDASNQIVISPRFAKLRGYNIGDKIKIGDFNFMITGIGGDNWTVLPSTNQLNPIPNYANEPIVFLKNWVFFDNVLQYKQIVQDISSVYLTHQGTKDTIEKDLTNYKALLSD